MIEKGNSVKIHYTGKLEDGQVFDSSKDREPLEITIGSNQIIAKLEESMIGMDSGDEKTIELEIDEAYGEMNEELVKEMPIANLPEGIEVGTPLKGTTPEGDPLTSVVKEIKENTAVLDFNHVLAGKKLIFDINVVEVMDNLENNGDEITDESSDEDDSDEESGAYGS